MRLLPPHYFLFYLLSAIGLDRLFPAARVIPQLIRPAGAVLAVAGLFMICWAASLFRRRETTLKPFERSTVLVIEGPYVYTRNPMYIGGVTMMLGIALWMGNVLAFAAPAALYLTLDHFFIPMEEGMLRHIFGRLYLDYQKQVRRWI